MSASEDGRSYGTYDKSMDDFSDDYSKDYEVNVKSLRRRSRVVACIQLSVIG